MKKIFPKGFKGKPFKFDVEAFEKSAQNARADLFAPSEPPKCRWCGSQCRGMNSNGIIGPGHAFSDWVCTACGKVQ